MKNPFGLENKTAIIFGASSGMGKHFAETLSNYGARVILASRRIDELKNQAKNLKNASFIEVDISNKDSIINLFKKLEEQGEKIDICVNTAGVATQTPIFSEQDDFFEGVIKTNLSGCWYVTKFSAIHMKKHKIHGSIINIGSMMGDVFSGKNLAAYASSKAGVMQLTKVLVNELSEFNIRINCISPGLINTPMTDWKLNDDEKREKVSRQIPVGFIASEKDLDGALLLFASNELSAYITGSCITVDGGKSFSMKWD